MLLCPAKPLDPRRMKKKIALFCNIDDPAIIARARLRADDLRGAGSRWLTSSTILLNSIAHYDRDLGKWRSSREPVKKPRRWRSPSSTCVPGLGATTAVGCDEALAHSGIANDGEVGYPFVDSELE